ncbi:MCE family protein [Amycolatopsis umgeniensis]|uniref:Phospholipid/cholesterol/gamma-HCH transport system substrate-binding protein n=1 Tax=Amycolatopsis umgeniensis TaxID=336628 RepID=A0A841B095_9PSEU|nr:MCE family protein [Amycolatopsis umgeniensis]MBB5852095.1 phospholipid/cholesterol/gamma-HCH transport system substrate-binding protein [Amycolatopsis umgeniensis]
MRAHGKVLGLVVTAGLLGGCGVSLQNLDSVTGVDGPSYRITAVFTEVSGLPAGGEVKLGPTAVGKVISARSENFQAHVTLELREDVKLPKGTRAELKLSTALGDQYVDLLPPARAGGETLPPGAVIPVADTARGPDVENTLALLGTVLDNSGFEQARTIITELNTMLSGREDKIRDLLSRVDGILSTLDARTTDFKRTLESLGKLSKTTADNKALLDTAFTRITPAVRMLRDQQGALNAMLASVPPLANVAGDTLGRTKDSLTRMASDLGPILDAFNGFAGDLGRTLGALKTVGGVLDKSIPGDYLDIDLTVNVPASLSSLFTSFLGGPASPPGSPLPGDAGAPLMGGTR